MINNIFGKQCDVFPNTSILFVWILKHWGLVHTLVSFFIEMCICVLVSLLILLLTLPATVEYIRIFSKSKKKLLFNREYKKIHTFNFFACYVILFSKKNSWNHILAFSPIYLSLEASTWLCVLINQSTKLEISKIQKKSRQKAKII